MLPFSQHCALDRAESALRVDLMGSKWRLS